VKRFRAFSLRRFSELLIGDDQQDLAYQATQNSAQATVKQYRRCELQKTPLTSQRLG
jgi:hypothetical protein